MISIPVINQAVQKAFTNILKPASKIPSILMICSLLKRPGLSCLKSTANIIANQAKFGAPTGDLPDGTSNMMNGLINIITCEIFRALREDANIQLAIAPKAITVQTNGANAAGPVISVGFNILPVTGVVQIL